MSALEDTLGDAGARGEAVRDLWRARPRSDFVRASVVAFGLLLVGCWFWVGADLGVVFSADGADDAAHFFTEEARPKPLRGKAWDWGVAADWVGAEMDVRGWSAASATLAISILAIVLAALFGGLFAWPAARTFATAEAFLPGGREPTALRRFAWQATVALTRFGLVLMRSLPEYVLAFLLFTIVGKSAWPAVLALMIHNTGILGRLNAEVIENLPSRTLEAKRAAGAGRAQLALFAVMPAALPRFLMYFFYRWETCVREATVLSMIGIAGLGYWINDADARGREDVLLLYILVSSALVLVGDFVSAIARRIVRQAS